MKKNEKESKAEPKYVVKQRTQVFLIETVPSTEVEICLDLAEGYRVLLV